MKWITQQISKMKTIKIFLFAFFLFAAGITNAQVGIGIANPNASAQLDVSSTSKGFLPPRMTLAQRNAIASPATGLTIWCKDCGVLGEIQVYNGAIWTNMTGGYPSTPIPSTVTIGTHVWMTKNLDVVTYRNGDTIPEVKDPTEWANLTTGAWCYYNNDPALNAIYGKLYNAYAVQDPRGLAPLGWHLPDTQIWDSLQVIYHDFSDLKEIRATSLWDNPNSGIGNESGFTALPGGQRNIDGTFSSLGTYAKWWGGDINLPFVFHGDYSESYFYHELTVNTFLGPGELLFHTHYSCPDTAPPTCVAYDEYTYVDRNGFSVRCVKD